MKRGNRLGTENAIRFSSRNDLGCRHRRRRRLSTSTSTPATKRGFLRRRARCNEKSFVFEKYCVKMWLGSVCQLCCHWLSNASHLPLVVVVAKWFESWHHNWKSWVWFQVAPWNGWRQEDNYPEFRGKGIFPVLAERGTFFTARNGESRQRTWIASHKHTCN